MLHNYVCTPVCLVFDIGFVFARCLIWIKSVYVDYRALSLFYARSNKIMNVDHQPIPIFPYFPIFFIFSLYFSETFLYIYNFPIFYIFFLYFWKIKIIFLWRCTLLNTAPRYCLFTVICVHISICVYAQLQEGKVLLRPRVLVLLNGQR